jgi:SAM-dependent methyltransferase
MKDNCRGFLSEFLKAYAYLPPQALWRAIEARLLSRLSFEQPVLDLGCGDGLVASILFREMLGKIAVGCDMSEDCVRLSKLQGIYEQVDIADACALPYSDEVFATVFSNCVLEHIPALEKALQEASRVLQKGGRLIFTVPSEKLISNSKYYHHFKNRGQEKQALAYIEAFNKRFEHYHYYSPQQWQELLAKAGLTLEHYQYFLPRPVQQLWETWTQVAITKLRGREFYTYFLNSKVFTCTGLNRVLGYMVPPLFSRYLSRWCEMGIKDDGNGGALLVVARK